MKINYVSQINVTFKTINKVNKKISHIVHFTFNDSLISLVERSSMQNSWVCVEIFQYMKRNVSYIKFMKKCLVSLLLSYIVMRLFKKKSKKKIKRVLNLGTNLWGEKKKKILAWTKNGGNVFGFFLRILFHSLHFLWRILLNGGKLGKKWSNSGPTYREFVCHNLTR